MHQGGHLMEMRCENAKASDTIKLSDPRILYSVLVTMVKSWLFQIASKETPIAAV